MNYNRERYFMWNQKGEGSRDAKGKGLAVPPPLPTVQQATTDHDQLLDLKRLKRTKINRESSQRLRMRREKKIKDLEDMCKFYESRMRGLPASTAQLKNQIESLIKENDEIRANIFALRANCDSREVEEMLLRREIEELNQLYVMQMQEEEQRLQMLQQQQRLQQMKLEEQEYCDQFLNPSLFQPNYGDTGNFFHGGAPN